MSIRLKNFFAMCFCLAILSGCGDYQKIEKSSDVNLKLTKANEYYEKHDYSHANELYKSLLGVMKNTRNYEQLYFRYAYSYYYMKEYLEASYHFKNFVDYFPNSKDAEECEFMHGVCLYKYSPKYSLDQTNTIKAMEALQSFINTHPKSKYMAEANGYVASCDKKLEAKAQDAAQLYYNINQFKAASIAYRSVMHTYPESPEEDKYLYMIIKSLYSFAIASVPEKQEERLANTISAYQEMKDTFPKSRYLGDAEKYYALATLNVKKIRNEHK